MEFPFLMAGLNVHGMKLGDIWKYFTSIILPIENKKLIPIQRPTPFGCCIDINHLLNIITHSQSDCISRLKLQVDVEKDFLKMSLNIISMSPDSLYAPTPNSVLSNFVVAM